jgi:hypothetical protein
VRHIEASASTATACRRDDRITEAALKTDIVVHRDFTLAPVDPCLFGVHLGPAGGPDERALLDPAHPAADETGIRTDVLDLARAYRLPCAIAGPDDAGGDGARVDAMLDWCRRGGMEPMLDIVHPGAHPFLTGGCADVRMWHLGRRGPSEAGDRFDEIVDRLRDADPASRIALSAPASGSLADLGALASRATLVDLVALAGRTGGLRALGADIDRLVARLDAARILGRDRRPIGIQVDQWTHGADARPATAGLDRAMAVNALLRRADRVRVAFAGGVVAGIARLMSERFGMGHRPTLYDPVLAGSIYGRGIALMPATRDRADGADVAAVHDPETEAVTIFLANPAEDEARVAVELVGYAAHVVAEHRLAAPEPRLPGPPPAGPAYDGRRLSVVIPAGGYGLVRLAPRRS